MYTHKSYSDIAVDRFVANNHGNQEYSESSQNDFNTGCKYLELYQMKYTYSSSLSLIHA